MPSTQRVIRMLREEYPEAEIGFSGGSHIRLRLPEGGVVIVSASPSDVHFIDQVRRDVRRRRARRENAP